MRSISARVKASPSRWAVSTLRISAWRQPDGLAESTITVNGTTIRLDSATNLYYSIKNAIGTDKVVTITNTGDGMVADQSEGHRRAATLNLTPARLRWARYSPPCRRPARRQSVRKGCCKMKKTYCKPQIAFEALSSPAASLPVAHSGQPKPG